MAVLIIMPRQGQSVESCIISKWLKKKGDKVNVGDIIFSYETDKAAFEFESPAEGTLIEIFFEEGDDVPVLTNVCVIGNAGEDASRFKPGGIASEAAEAATSAPVAISGELKISPRARNLAAKEGLGLRYAQGTGPDGRIIEKDIRTLIENMPTATVSAAADLAKARDAKIIGTGIGGRITVPDIEKAAQNKTAEPSSEATAMAAEFEDMKIPNIRKIIAKAMHDSLANTAQLTLNSSFDATEIMAFREKLKSAAEKFGLEDMTLNDMLIFAVSRTLLRHKDLNAHFLDDTMRRFSHVHMGIAVDTERGLMVPTIFNTDVKSLEEISREVKSLASQCQKGTISPDVLKGASFTISNLGALGIESFTPVINPPQTGILGVDSIIRRPRESASGVEFYPAMGLSLTFDHRAADGGPVARFLQDLKNALENFSALLAR